MEGICLNKKFMISLAVIGMFVLIFFSVYIYNAYENSNASWSLPLSGKVIVIDPGHGGVDGGAVGKGEIIEKEIALEISLKLREYLQGSGAFVVMTRETDRDLAPEDLRGYSRRKTYDLHKRLEIINEPDHDLFVSIHLNAVPSPRWRGAQTFFHPANEESQKLSRFIQDELRKNLGNTDRYAKKLTNVFLLKEAKIPGAIVEVGFLSNPDEAQLLSQKDYQNKIAISIYQGILRYFTNEAAPKK